jgi:hypothetical protein
MCPASLIASFYEIPQFLEESFHQQTGLKFKEETSKVLHLEHSFAWC